MRLHEAILGVAEVTGRPLSDAAVAIMVRALSRYPAANVAEALHRCAAECRHQLTLADILDRLPGRHPGPEEAWSIAAKAFDESETVVWTPEIAEAFGSVRHLDPIAARMAFKEAYRAIVAGLMDPPEWVVNSGHDVALRAAAVEEGVAKGRLAPGRYDDVIEASRQLPRGATHILPPACQEVPVSDEETAQLGRSLVEALGGLRSFPKQSPEALEERRRLLREQAERLAAGGDGE